MAQPLLNLARAHYAPTQQSFPRKKSYFKEEEEEEEEETEPEKTEKASAKPNIWSKNSKIFAISLNIISWCELTAIIITALKKLVEYTAEDTVREVLITSRVVKYKEKWKTDKKIVIAGKVAT